VDLAFARLGDLILLRYRSQVNGALATVPISYASSPLPSDAVRDCGGEPCIVRTRIPFWVLEQARQLGTSEADLLRAYPTLRAQDLANAWAYVRTHRGEIEEQIRANEEA